MGRSIARLAAAMLAVAVLATSTLAPVTGHLSAAPATSALVPVGPIRLADTRRPDCGCDPTGTGTFTVDVTGRAEVPDGAVAAALTITALRTATPGYVTVAPSGAPLPDTSTLNTRPDRVVANSTIVALGDDGRVQVGTSRPGDVVVDLTAVFVPADQARAGRYVPVNGRRLLDTRTPTAPTGAIAPGGELGVPLPRDVAADATAVVVNVTNVGEARAGYLSARPAGTPPTGTSMLNPNGSGRAVAATAIVPVSADGFVVESHAGGHLVVDLLGWFTGPSADGSATGLFVPTAPRRLLDSRRTSEHLHAGGGLELGVPAADASAAVTNVTATRADRAGYVTAFPAGTPVPPTSTVNPSFWNHTVANLAITRTGTRGLAYRSSAGTDLVVDLTGWFTGSPVASTEPPPTNEATRSRVLLVGDSTLAALELMTSAQAAFIGFDAVVDAESCRRLLRPSCRSDTTGRIPNTAVEAIADAPGAFDVVVVKTGYNDWFSDFPGEFDAVVRTARAKGAHTIVWLTYNEDVARPLARLAYAENNADLRRLVTLPGYTDVHLADWLSYSRHRQEWFYDGTHLTPDGTWAVADYVSRWMAAIEHRPCPRPWAPGGAVDDPCPAPDLIGAVADPAGLYR